MKIEEEREYTAKILGLEISEIDYITPEYLEEMKTAEEETEENAELVGDDKVIILRSGYYCNSVRIGSGSNKGWVFYKRGDKGTSRYGCSQKHNKKYKMSVGDEIRTIGTCPQGYKEKFVGRW